MTRDRFRRLVDEALATIPEDFREAMQNIAIVIEDEPTAEQLEEVGIEPEDTLLGLCRRHRLSSIDAIKLDVEGAEDLILCPFFEDAPHELWPRMLLVENSEDTWRQDVQGLLLSKGYRRKEIPSRNMVFVRSADQDPLP